MPITDLLERNCRLYGNDTCLVEINPQMRDSRRVTWKEYELSNLLLNHITDGKSHGTYLMKKPTGLLICC